MQHLRVARCIALPLRKNFMESINGSAINMGFCRCFDNKESCEIFAVEKIFSQTCVQ